MKTLTLWTIILVLFTSCSSDSESNLPETNQNDLNNIQANRKTSRYPDNSANVYDSAGQLYYDICESYLTQEKISITTTGTITQIETIADVYPEYQNLRPAAYVSPTAVRIDFILSDQASALSAINTSSLTLKSKASVTVFLTTLMLYRDLKVDYDVIHQLVTDYEATIISDSGITADDRKTILVSTSIIRNAVYFAKKTQMEAKRP